MLICSNLRQLNSLNFFFKVNELAPHSLCRYSFKEQEESSDQEIKLVESITAGGGIRLNPGRAELQEFVKG